MKFETYDDLVDQSFSQLNENLIKNWDSHSQIESDETPGANYPNENYSEVGETNRASALLNFISQILPDDEIAEAINSSNSKQREVFNVIHTWDKDYVKYDECNVQPIHIFFSGRGGTGKSNLVKLIYSAIPKALLYYFIAINAQKDREFFTWTYRNISGKYR